MAQPRCFQVGDAFSSYEDLKKHVEEPESLSAETRLGQKLIATITFY